MIVVYSYYVLDLVHRGHLLQMQNAKAIAGDDGRSVVGILTDGAVLEKKTKKPVLGFDNRVRLAQNIKYVDLVVPQTDYSPLSNLEMIQPDICMESGSHDIRDVDNVRRCMKRLGGRVVVTPYYPDSSSTIIKDKIKENR